MDGTVFSLGPFLICFLATVFLAIYLYVVLYKSSRLLVDGIKIVFIGIAIIFARMIVPINFPFSMNIYLETLLEPLRLIAFTPFPGTEADMSCLFMVAWTLGTVYKAIVLIKRNRSF